MRESWHVLTAKPVTTRATVVMVLASKVIAKANRKCVEVKLAMKVVAAIETVWQSASEISLLSFRS